MIVDGFTDQCFNILLHFLSGTNRFTVFAKLIIKDRPGMGRGFGPHMIGHDDGPGAFAPDLNFNFIALHQIAV